MGILSKQQVFQANDLPRELVEVPEWGGSLYIRTLSGIERDSYEQSLVLQKSKSTQLNFANARAKLVALCAVDEQGNRIFDETDTLQLGRKSAKVLDKLFDVARRLSGLSDDDVEELTKNSESGPSAASFSA